MASQELETSDRSKREVRLGGKVLFLTRDPRLIRKQLEDQSPAWVDSSDLIDAISTDNIIPNGACYSSRTADELAEYLLTGLPGGVIQQGEIKNRGFEAIVAGKSFGRGSSREHAQLALLGSGIKYIVAGGFERIFHENCRNYGILTMNGGRQELAKRLISRHSIPFGHFLTDLNPLHREILEQGGLLQFTKARVEGSTSFRSEVIPKRQMTMVEKIIAHHITLDPNKDDRLIGAGYVQPGNTTFVRIDHGYGYELQVHVCVETLNRVFGDNFTINSPEKFFFFEDHLALLENNPNSEVFRRIQRDFASKSGCKIYGLDPKEGVEGICHTVMLEQHAKPGQIIIGNDSHTCTLGAVGAFAIGKGTSELAASFVTGDTAVAVPETIRFNLRGRLRLDTTSKDLMLHILALSDLRDNLIGSGKVFEFSGMGLETMSFDEQVVLANMSIEGNAFTGIVEPNERSIDYLARRTGFTREQLTNMVIKSDPGATFTRIFDIDLSKIEPMIALPGDPQQGVPLHWLRNSTPINIAYIGSCTGGKLEDLQRAANILSGRNIANSVDLYIQASSRSILRAAFSLGLIEIFQKSGAKILMPGCGACMNAGPGSSTDERQVTISNTNRNFHGRMGKGQTFLANTEVVAASAIRGRISSPLDL